MRAALVLGVVLLVAGVFSASAAPAQYTIKLVNGRYIVQTGQGGIADALFDIQSVNVTGWSTLTLTSKASPNYKPATEAYAAGYLEGYLTAEMIYMSYVSTLESAFDSSSSTLPTGAATFLNSNIAWTNSMVSQNPSHEIWITVGYTVKMLEGMLDGYNAAFQAGQVQVVGARQLTLTDIWFLNSDGDMEEIAVLQMGQDDKSWKLNEEKIIPRRLDLTSKPATGIPVTRQPIGSHCSVLVKVTPDLSNIFFGHTTWEDYVQMLRIYKTYDLSFYGTKISSSAYPAVITSIDDFYVTSNKLAVTETTNGIFSPALYAKIVPQALLSWMRAMVANVRSKSCVTWMDLFGQYNSGTYNNQWICVDYNLFTPQHDLKKGTLMIGEQIPGLFLTADETKTLSLGYWPSYNIPFFKEIYDLSGFNTQIDIGDFFKYAVCPRAKIFRRDQSSVVDINSMQKMMRYNNWQHDPFSEGNPCNAISSRCDLVQGWSPNPATAQAAFGSTDGKITDYHAIQQMGAYIQSGPTWDIQPAFTWANQLWSAQPHDGQPTTFRFPWIYVSSN